MTIDERAFWSMSLSPSSRFGLDWQMEFMTELCSELNHGVVFSVGGHTECWGDGMCSEMRGGDIPSERVVEKGVPLQMSYDVTSTPTTLMHGRLVVTNLKSRSQQQMRRDR